MAKNFHQKKRVTHIGKVSNDLKSVDRRNDEKLWSESECIDYVHNIMQEMDNKSFDSYKHNQTSDTKVLKNHEVQNDKISSSSDLSNCKASNIKKYSIPRKYPLMEKSEKILKQLQHNRKIPKQRAHLASLQNSSVNEVSKYKTSIISEKKSKGNSVPKEKIPKKNINKNAYNSCLEHKNLKQISKNTETSNKFQGLPKQSQPQKTTEKSLENSNSCLSDATTDSEYERFVRKNKQVLENQKKSKKNVKNNKKTTVNKKMKSQKKSSSLKKNNSRNIVEDVASSTDYSSYDSDANEICKRKKSPVQKLNIAKNKKLKTNINSEYNEYETQKKKTRKVARKKSQKLKEDSDTGNSLQSWLEQCDSNFCTESSESDNENIHERKNSIARRGEKISLNSEVNDVKRIDLEAASDNLVHAREKNFSTNHSYSTVKDNSVQFELTENLAANVSNLSSDSKLASCLKYELNPEDSLPKSTVTVNSTLHSFTHNQPEEKTQVESHLRISELPSSTTKLSENSLENIPVITLSSSESDTELETVSVSEKRSEVVTKTQNMVICNSDFEEPDLEIIDVLSPKKNLPLCKTLKESKNLTVVDTRSLYIQDGITQSENTSNKETAKCLQFTDEINCIPKTVISNALENALSKEKIKEILSQCNLAQVKKEKVTKNIHSATYSTDICKDVNENESASKSNELSKNSHCDHASQILGNANSKSINITPSTSSDILSTYSVKQEKTDDDVIIIDSEVPNVAKEVVTNDIDSFIKSHSTDISKLSSAANPLRKETISSSFKADTLSGNSLQNYLVHYTDIPKLLNLNNSSILQSDVTSEYPVYGSNLPDANVQKTVNVIENELFSQASTSSVEVPVENAVHLLELYKKEFQTYQEILQAEKNVQAGLKFVETHQAEKLRYLRSQIQNVFKNNSDVEIDNCVTNKEQNNLVHNCDILNNSKTPILHKKQHTFHSCSEVEHSKPECSTVQNPHINGNSQTTSQSSTSAYDLPVFKKESEDDSVTRCSNLEIIPQVQNPIICKTEKDFEEKLSDNENVHQNSVCVKSEEKTLILLDKKCNVCGKDALGACQRCAKVFFCSEECGLKFWTDGHEKICGL